MQHILAKGHHNKYQFLFCGAGYGYVELVADEILTPRGRWSLLDWESLQYQVFASIRLFLIELKWTMFHFMTSWALWHVCLFQKLISESKAESAFFRVIFLLFRKLTSLLSLSMSFALSAALKTLSIISASLAQR